MELVLIAKYGDTWRHIADNDAHQILNHLHFKIKMMQADCTVFRRIN